MRLNWFGIGMVAIGVVVIGVFVLLLRDTRQCGRERATLVTVHDSVAYLFRCGSPNKGTTPVIVPMPIQH